jgi:hypothetical protein
MVTVALGRKLAGRNCAVPRAASVVQAAIAVPREIYAVQVACAVHRGRNCFLK